MSAEDKIKKVLGEGVVTPEIVDAGVKDSKNVSDIESVMSNSDGGVQTSVAPQIDGATDSESISIIEKGIKGEKKDEEEIKSVLFPKLFVNQEELIDVVIEVVFNPENGDVYSISQPGMINVELLDILTSVKYNFKFRPVSYDDMQKYRRQASFYDANAGDLVINRLQLRNFLLINHLRETDMVDENGQPFDIKIDEESDNLSIDSLTRVYQTTPALLDVILTLFERKLLILFQASQANM